jgi:NAD(P)H dehydrogenase (quinone)
MKSVVVVYHSGYGHTAKQAQAVLDGVKSINNIAAQIIAIAADIEINWD